ncbi:EAL domain-containing protein [Bradyrhizobium canariense]|uniref:EAL domain-containing protein n=1 Tax=Bradyrhizobium canariense TaxID=255045 RepID=UPI001FDA9576|nr:EAL domain-containing protein [Bradyrhizobium canariense]
MRHSCGGSIPIAGSPPGEFIPVAERSGPIAQIDDWVLMEACREAALWDRPFRIAVNVSAAQFRRENLDAQVRFPLDRIKIGRSFVASLGQCERSLAIVRAVIGLAHGLGVPVLAEGIETKVQMSHLIEEGCDQMQGYLIGRPQRIAAARSRFSPKLPSLMHSAS